MNGNQGYQHQQWLPNKNVPGPQTGSLPGQFSNSNYQQGQPPQASNQQYGVVPPPGGFPQQQQGQSPRPVMHSNVSSNQPPIPGSNLFNGSLSPQHQQVYPQQQPQHNHHVPQQNEQQQRNQLPPQTTNNMPNGPAMNGYANGSQVYPVQQPLNQTNGPRTTYQVPPVTNGPSRNGPPPLSVPPIGPVSPTLPGVPHNGPSAAPSSRPLSGTPTGGNFQGSPLRQPGQMSSPPLNFQQPQQAYPPQQYVTQPAISPTTTYQPPTAGPPTYPGPPSNQGQPPVQMTGGPAQARRPMYPAMPSQQQSTNFAPVNPATHYNGGPHNGQGEYGQQQLINPMAGMSVRDGMNKMWGVEPVNLLQERDLFSAEPPISDFQARNCSPEVMRCTMTKIPETSSLLQKSRLPLGIVMQPFRDLENLPVIQTNLIVRCRACRTYINPFIQFVDRTRWKCNICFRFNDLPSEFLHNPMTGRLGDPEQRPEIQNGTVEFIAPSEYMVRPPQAATYLFVLDVSFQAVETGYLKVATDILLECLDQLPGDKRTTVGFITFDSSVHFYSLDGGSGQPRQMIVTDVEDVFIPTPETLLCNLKECRMQVEELLKSLGTTQSGGPGNCLGAALQAAFKLLSPIGGRVSVFQCCLPNLGPGSLQSRENPNERSAKEVVNLNPATDFYKKLALECTGVQIGVDIFLLNSQFADLATLSGIAKFSSGQVYYFPKFHVTQAMDQVEKFSNQLRHYLTRKIGFESVMRIRCTRGLQLHTFHGNFFVRSTDLLALPNVNPDAAYALQVSIEENLTDCTTAVFQTAVLYTSAHGERRIRVHTMCLGVSSILQDILNGADQEAVVGLLAKMAVDRTLSCSVNDARDAMINAAADLCHAYALTQRSSGGGLLLMRNCKTLPLYILGLLKQRAFRVGVSTKLDDRIYDMERIKNLPLDKLLLLIYPALYPLHHQVAEPPRMPLSFEKVDKTGLYLLETVDALYIYVGGRLNPLLLQNVFGVSKFSQLPDNMSALPELDNADSIRVREFVDTISSNHVIPPPLWILREDSQFRTQFTQYMLNDRGESVLSYYEFLQHLRNQLDSY